MDKTPLVSVLVTPYNQAAYIRQTLDSILMQRCSFDFEIVIGEDCSTDGTREICQEYALQYPDQIVLCLNESNKGLLNNYFDIFLKARGRYLADCGGDDYWLTDSKLQEQVDLLEAHPDVSMVAGNWQLLEQKSGKLTKADSWIDEDWYQKDAFGQKAISNYLNKNEIPRMVLAASCFRGDWARELYRQDPALFRGSGVVCEDLPLTLGLLQRGPFYFSKNNWLIYRVLDKSLSHSDSQHAYTTGFAFSAYKQTMELARSLGVDLRQLKPYIHKNSLDFALYAFLSNDSDFKTNLGQVLVKYGLKPSFKHRMLVGCMQFPILAKPLRNQYLKRNLRP